MKGIELNPYAAELARVSVWIGEIQWMRRHGFREDRDPILKPLDTIECRDAVLTADSQEPEWPEADVVIGNPPFLGGNRLNAAECWATRTTQTRCPKPIRRLGSCGRPDLVCYWFAKAGASRCRREGRNALGSLPLTPFEA